MKAQPRKRYTSEFKAQAVELVACGKPVPEVAEDLGIGSGNLYRWVQASQPAQLGSGSLRAVGEEAEADELRRLRREIAHLKLENDILKKAAVILGTRSKPQSNGAI
jgi:transposase